MSTDLSPIPPQVLAPPGTEAAAMAYADAVAMAYADAVGVDEATHQLLSTAPRWRIDGTGSAEWAMAHVVEANATLDALAAQAAEWYERIDAWLAESSAEARGKLAFFTAHLERYALDRREADPKAKTLTLPSGKVRTTASPAAVVVTNPAAVLAWARQHYPGLVSQPPQPDERVLVSDLRTVVYASQVTTAAEVTNSCGCVVHVRDDEGLDLPPVGTEVECSQCHQPALLGSVEGLAHRWLALTADGAHVPGVDVAPPTVKPDVVPG